MSDQQKITEFSRSAEQSDSAASAEESAEFGWGSFGKPPEDWPLSRVEELFEIQKDSADPDELEKEELVQLYSMPAFDDGEEPELIKAGDIGSKKFYVPNQALLFSKLNISKKRFWLVNHSHDEPAFCSTEYWPLLPANGLNLEFYLQYFNSDSFIDRPRLSTSSTTNSHQRIKSNLFDKVRLPVPPLSEQRKIATVLYTVDRAIEKTEEIIEQTEKIGRGLRQSLFTEGYYEHETESYGTLGEVPVSWEKTRLYKIADVARGKFTHRPRNDPEFYDGEYPFIQTGEVVEAVGELTDFSQTLNEKGRGVSKEFTPGTIIITIAGNIGDTAVATFPVYFPDSLVGITPDEATDERFLEHFLRYRQAFLNRLSTKTTQKNLNLTLLRPIEVVKPPLDEQKEIADTLSTVDNQIKKEKEYKNHLQRLKRGLMQDLLSGIVRTTDTNIEVPEEIAQYG